MSQYLDCGLVNHTNFMAVPADAGWFLEKTALNVVSVGDKYTAASGLKTSEVPCYSTVGVGILSGTHNTSNTSVTVKLYGLSMEYEPQSESVTVTGNNAVDPVVSWTTKVWSRVDQVEVTAISGGQATDVLTVGYPMPTTGLDSAAIGSLHYRGTGVDAGFQYGLPRAPAQGLHREGTTRALLELDSSGGGSTAAADGDVLVLTDSSVTLRWELDDDFSTTTGYTALNIALLSSIQIRDAIIVAINAAGTHLTARVPTDVATANHAVEVIGGNGQIYLELFRWASGSPTGIGNVAFEPQRRIYCNSSAPYTSAADPLPDPGDFIEVTEGSNSDRFEFGTTVATGSIAIAIPTPGAGSTEVLRNRVWDAINIGAVTTSFKAFNVAGNTDYAVLVNGEATATIKTSNTKIPLKVRVGKTTFPAYKPRFFSAFTYVDWNGGTLGGGNLKFTNQALTGYRYEPGPCRLVLEEDSGEPSAAAPREPRWDNLGGAEVQWSGDVAQQQPSAICAVETHSASLRFQSYDDVVGFPSAGDSEPTRAGGVRGRDPQHGGRNVVSGSSDRRSK